MKALVDTHAILWAAFASRRVGARAAELMNDKANTILVSAASAWEIATKVRLGRLPEAAPLERDFKSALGAAGYTFLPISIDDALRAGRLPSEHRDPFDRMIAAQALALDIPVISLDTRLDAFGIRRVW